MLKAKFLPLLFTCFFLTACPLNQPLEVGDISKVSGDVQSVALRYNAPSQDMKPVDVTLHNVRNLEALGGANYDVYFESVFSDMSIATQTEFSVEINNVSPSGLNFQKVGDRYVPSDYHTFLFTSVYHNFETAHANYQRLFDAAGVRCTNCFRRMAIHIDPADITGQFSMVDNAAYITGLDVFILFPQKKFLFVNVGMNEPIVMHEVFHSIFEPLVDSFYVGSKFLKDPENITEDHFWNYFGHGLPLPIGVVQRVPIENGVRINVSFSLSGFTAESYAVLNMLNEGLADYFSFVITNNSDILFHSFGDISVGGQNLRENRRMDKDHAFPPAEFNSDFASTGFVKCDSTANLKTCISLRAKYQYVVGSVIARSLVQIGDQIKDHERVARVVISFLPKINNLFATASSIKLADVIGQLIGLEAASAGLKTQFCTVFMENFRAISTKINTTATCN